MFRLTVVQDGRHSKICFEGEALLSDVLEAHGFETAHPCGGRGKCGKCAVAVEGEISAPDAAEMRVGTRLACRTWLLGDAKVILPKQRGATQIELRGNTVRVGRPISGKLGAAVDIGTTTIALRLYDLHSGSCIAECGMENPQTSVAADVMGRIGAALEGRLEQMQQQVHDAVQALLTTACQCAKCESEDIDALILTGNTTMLYLLCGRSPETLAHAPFEADCLFDSQIERSGRIFYLPPCMNAFVGADISCAVLAAEQCKDRCSLLVDVGTNGEIALWKDGALYVCSTAAGPAFEGAGISCGCGSVAGAIDRVDLENGNLMAHTINDEAAVGICGSGLVDALACLLEMGLVDETGATDEETLHLRDGIALLPEDICAVQLAKAAIAAGIETLMETAEVTADEIETLYIAGGFGSHLNVQSAARIGLIPAELVGKVCVLGNAALTGAAMLLLDQECFAEIRGIAAHARQVNLGGNPIFSAHYMDHMFFPEE